MSFQTLKLGAGGFVDGICIANDGTRAARTDVGGGYTGAGTANWQQLLLASRFPAGDPLLSPAQSDGLYELVIAPTDSTRLYLYSSTFSGGRVYVSSNGGVSFTATGFAAVCTASVLGNDQTQEGWGPRAAVDPHNPDIVLVGTPANGIFRSTNAGTAFAAVASVPASTTLSPGGSASQNGGHCIAFDPSSWTSGNTPGVYVSVYGTGVYHSTDNGLTFSAMVGAPTTLVQLRVGPDGAIWATDSSPALHKWNGTAWSTPATGLTVGAVAVNPKNGNEVIAMGNFSGQVAYSSNGSTFTTLSSTGTATDIPWLINWKQFGWTVDVATAMLAFDPSTASATLGLSTVYMAEGTGVWKCQITGSGTQAWSSISAGIEELVVDWIVSPPGGKPLVACYDRPVFTVVDSTNTNYPTQYGPNYTLNICEGYTVDYAKLNPTTAVIWAQHGQGGGDQMSYTSNSGGTDGGAANWTLMTGLAGLTETVANGGGALNASLACSTSTNWVAALGNNDGGSAGLWFTTNAGATWARGTCAAHPFVNAAFTDGWGRHYYLNRNILCADFITSGLFFAYNHGGPSGTGGPTNSDPGVYRSTDGGATWTLQRSGLFDPTPLATTSQFNSSLRSVPGNSGHLYYTSGNVAPYPAANPFYVSTDGAGVTWTTVANVDSVKAFGFGPAKPGSNGYPAIYLYGQVSSVVGLWQGVNINTGSPTWTQLSGPYVMDKIDTVNTVEGDGNTYGKVYIGFQGTGAVVLSPDTVPAVFASFGMASSEW